MNEVKVEVGAVLKTIVKSKCVAEDQNDWFIQVLFWILNFFQKNTEKWYMTVNLAFLQYLKSVFFEVFKLIVEIVIEYCLAIWFEGSLLRRDKF